MTSRRLDDRVSAVRRFNRFYTQRIGLLRKDWAQSPFSLPEARVLYEIATRDRPAAVEIAKDLGFDPGYLSRILRDFAQRGLIARTASNSDGRRSLLSLTARGRKAFAPMERRTRTEINALLRPLSEAERSRLVASMQTIEHLVNGQPHTGASYVLRPPRPGDLGWVVSRHGALYAQEYGWDEHLEALCADVVGEFVRKFDPKRERCWIAEKDGENVGCIFLVKQSERVAKLRLLLVEPKARGLGIGVRLVDECLRFAREAGYRKVVLWTHEVLHAARRIYQQAGFRLVGKEPHSTFGRTEMGETWEIKL